MHLVGTLISWEKLFLDKKERYLVHKVVLEVSRVLMLKSPPMTQGLEERDSRKSKRPKVAATGAEGGRYMETRSNAAPKVDDRYPKVKSLNIGLNFNRRQTIND